MTCDPETGHVLVKQVTVNLANESFLVWLSCWSIVIMFSYYLRSTLVQFDKSTAHCFYAVQHGNKVQYKPQTINVYCWYILM